MTSRFTIDARGGLKPDASATAAELAQRAGQYLLIPTAADLLCALRVPLSGGRAASPRVVLLGDAAGFPVSDLIAFLSQSRWSGVLRVHTTNGERSVALKEGEVRGAASDDAADRLSEVLVRLGLASRASVEEALREVPPSKVGRALVDRGVLQAHQLWAAVNHQVTDIVHAMVLAREGVFVLLDQDLDERLHSSVQLSTQSLLMDAIRKIDELAHFRGRIPHGRLYVTKKRPSDGKLHPDEDYLLGLATGRRTVLELAASAHLSEFEATKVLFRLLEGGYASVSEVPAPEAPAPAAASVEPAVAAVRTFNAIFAEVLAEVARGGRGADFLKSANAALAGQSLTTFPVLQGLQFGQDGKLAERALLEAFARVKGTLGSEPVASLRAALSDVMFFLLFQAGELLESRADEELARRVKELLSALGE
ncbi:MAG: DUF4388 domain-containing protein [Myxococcaceae bacterium]